MDDLEYRVGRLQLAPGDVVVVKAKLTLTAEAVERIGKIMAEKLPDGVRALVIDDLIDLSVMSKTEAETRFFPVGSTRPLIFEGGDTFLTHLPPASKVIAEAAITRYEHGFGVSQAVDAAGCCRGTANIATVEEAFEVAREYLNTPA